MTCTPEPHHIIQTLTIGETRALRAMALVTENAFFPGRKIAIVNSLLQGKNVHVHSDCGECLYVFRCSKIYTAVKPQ